MQISFGDKPNTQDATDTYVVDGINLKKRKIIEICIRLGFDIERLRKIDFTEFAWLELKKVPNLSQDAIKMRFKDHELIWAQQMKELKKELDKLSRNETSGTTTSTKLDSN